MHKLTNLVYFGSITGDLQGDRNVLREQKINALINVADDYEIKLSEADYTKETYNFKIPEPIESYKEVVPIVREIIRIIESCVRDNKKVLIVCESGQNRSVVIAATWFAFHKSNLKVLSETLHTLENTYPIYNVTTDMIKLARLSLSQNFF